MNNRLQVGGSALIVGYDNSPHNLGVTVKLIDFMPYAMFDDGEVKTNAWVVFSKELIGRDGVTECHEMIYRQEHLQPLGDDAAIELYKLKEELTCNN
jgi:hypothetical protein